MRFSDTPLPGKFLIERRSERKFAIRRASDGHVLALGSEGAINRTAAALGMNERDLAGPGDASIIFHEMHDFSDGREVVMVLGVSPSGRPLGVHLAARGSLDAVRLSAESVLAPLRSDGAASFVLAHNHPSGDLTPSKSDGKLTEALRAAGLREGIEMLDHVILTADPAQFYSFFQG